MIASLSFVAAALSGLAHAGDGLIGAPRCGDVTEERVVAFADAAALASVGPEEAARVTLVLTGEGVEAAHAAVTHASVAGFVCMRLPGQVRTVAISAVSDLPLLGGEIGAAYVESLPLVLWATPTETQVARWPQPGIAVSAADGALLDRVVAKERGLHPQRRVAVVHADAGTRVETIGTLVDLLTRRGVSSVALHVGPSGWRPAPTEVADVASWTTLPVVSAMDTWPQPDGTYDLRFAPTVGRPLHAVAPEDVLGVQQACRAGTCDVVLVTATERFHVARRPEPPVGDLTHRWIFGAPVVPYAGPALGMRPPPALNGELAPIPVIRYFRASEEPVSRIGDIAIVGANDSIRLLAQLDDREELFSDCFLNQSSARWSTGLVRNPYGVIGIELDVAPDGRVIRAEIYESTVENLRLQACMIEAVRGTRFPRAVDGKPIRLRYGQEFGIRD